MTTPHSLLTCPHCGFQSLEAMPTDACIWCHDCGACHRTLTPKAGDCCVFCSYGDTPCPPIQLARSEQAPPGQGVAPCCAR